MHGERADAVRRRHIKNDQHCTAVGGRVGRLIELCEQGEFDLGRAVLPDPERTRELRGGRLGATCAYDETH